MSVDQEIPALVFIENSDGEGFYTAKVTSSENLVFVKNLSPFVSNEMLSTAFATFGEIKTSFVFVDSESDSLGCGLVAFATKQSATLAYRRCRDMHFLITSSTVPVKVSLLKGEATLGLPEILLNSDNRKLIKERAVGPRMINSNSPEKSYTEMWQQLLARESEAIKTVKEEFQLKREALEKCIENMIQEEDRKKLREKIKAIDRARNPTTALSSSSSMASNPMPTVEAADQTRTYNEETCIANEIKAIDRARNPTTALSSSSSMASNPMPTVEAADQTRTYNEETSIANADDTMVLENEVNPTAPFSSDEYF